MVYSRVCCLVNGAGPGYVMAFVMVLVRSGSRFFDRWFSFDRWLLVLLSLCYPKKLV